METKPMEVNEKVDQEIQCSDCGRIFRFTPGERRFYITKGLVYPPKRCAPCRRIRKLTIDPGAPVQAVTDGK